MKVKIPGFSSSLRYVLFHNDQQQFKTVTSNKVNHIQNILRPLLDRLTAIIPLILPQPRIQSLRNGLIIGRLERRVEVQFGDGIRFIRREREIHRRRFGAEHLAPPLLIRRFSAQFVDGVIATARHIDQVPELLLVVVEIGDAAAQGIVVPHFLEGVAPIAHVDLKAGQTGLDEIGRHAAAAVLVFGVILHEVFDGFEGEEDVGVGADVGHLADAQAEGLEAAETAVGGYEAGREVGLGHDGEHAGGEFEEFGVDVEAEDCGGLVADLADEGLLFS